MKPGPWEEDNIVLKSQSALRHGMQCRRLEATVTLAGQPTVHTGLVRGITAKREVQALSLGFYPDSITYKLHNLDFLINI